jgi:uncharacterized membrane protein YoaK (UPF0700 family)
VDALGWLTLDEVFTAHMSGNTVGLTVHVALGDWSEVAKRAAVIAYFLLGLAAGATMVTVAYRRGTPNGFTGALAIEACVLVAFVAAAELLTQGAPVPRSATGAYFAMLAAPPFAMGIQSATLRRAASTRARTTYLTGILTRLVENLVAWTACIVDRRCGRAREADETKARRHAAVLASIFAVYATGGIAAALLERLAAVRAFVLPIALLAVAIALDLRLAGVGIHEAGPEEG